MRHPLIVVDELAYPLLIGTDVLRPHRANFELGAPDVVQLKLDRGPVCVEERLPDAMPRVIVGAVDSILVDDVTPGYRESCASSPSPQSNRRLGFSRRAAAARTCNCSVRCSSRGVRYPRRHSRAVRSKLFGQACRPFRRHFNRRSVFPDTETKFAVI